MSVNLLSKIPLFSSIPPKDLDNLLSLLDTQNSTDADEITALATAELEAAIRRTPEQWLWMHKRWKTSPIES